MWELQYTFGCSNLNDWAKIKSGVYQESLWCGLKCFVKGYVTNITHVVIEVFGWFERTAGSE